jgi:hypothetical protein
MGHPAFVAGVAKLSVVVELTAGSVGGVLPVNPKLARSGAVPSSNARFGISSQNEPGSAPGAYFLRGVSSPDGTFVTVLRHSKLHLKQQESL